MRAKERLWLTADKKRLVPDGHVDGATLYAAAGDDVPPDAAETFGLVDGMAPRASNKVKSGGSKQEKPGEDKQGKPGENKSGEGKTVHFGGDHTQQSEAGGSSDPTAAAPQADDLTAIKGIGPASAKALVDAGIAGFAALAAVDPANPPEIAGLGANPAWAGWVEQAAGFAKAEA